MEVRGVWGGSEKLNKMETLVEVHDRGVVWIRWCQDWRERRKWVGRREDFKHALLENVTLPVAPLKSKTEKRAQGGGVKELRKLPPEEWRKVCPVERP